MAHLMYMTAIKSELSENKVIHYRHRVTLHCVFLSVCDSASAFSSLRTSSISSLAKCCLHRALSNQRPPATHRRDRLLIHQWDPRSRISQDGFSIYERAIFMKEEYLPYSLSSFAANRI